MVNIYSYLKAPKVKYTSSNIMSSPGQRLIGELFAVFGIKIPPSSSVINYSQI